MAELGRGHWTSAARAATPSDPASPASRRSMSSERSASRRPVSEIWAWV